MTTTFCDLSTSRIGGGCGADGGDVAVVHGVHAQQVVEGSEGGKVGGAGEAAGEYQKIGLAEIGPLEDEVGLDGDAVGADDFARVGDGDGAHLKAGAAQKVYLGQGLDFLKALS